MTVLDTCSQRRQRSCFPRPLQRHSKTPPYLRVAMRLRDRYILCPCFVKGTVDCPFLYTKGFFITCTMQGIVEVTDFSQKPSELSAFTKEGLGLWDGQEQARDSHLFHSLTSAGDGAMETRSRHSSYPAGTEEDEGMEEELSPFRGRSRSAPPNLWAAQRYGRELRRMSDEFEGSFKVSASVRCDGT